MNLEKESVRGSDSDLMQLVTFRIGVEEFGVEILRVQEIIRSLEITKVPNAPDIVDGIINLRGRVIPIVDLRKKFNLPSAGRTKDTRIIVVNIKEQTVGFVVDAVSEVFRLTSDNVEPPPPVIAGIDSDYIQGVGKVSNKLLILLDLDRLLSAEEHGQLDAVA